jgi:hypothetical protein
MHDESDTPQRFGERRGMHDESDTPQRFGERRGMQDESDTPPSFAKASFFALRAMEDTASYEGQDGGHRRDSKTAEMSSGD